jgi:hypothetical protein
MHRAVRSSKILWKPCISYIQHYLDFRGRHLEIERPVFVRIKVGFQALLTTKEKFWDFPPLNVTVSLNQLASEVLHSYQFDLNPHGRSGTVGFD